MTLDRATWKTILNRTVIVSALGYFVDIYDLLLFLIIRRPSLEGIGIPFGTPRHEDVGLLLLNVQMAGLLLGGILWGVLGDKVGRVRVLFGSILLYSLANLANAAVTTVPAYAAARFLAGIGLAGELGAAVTLVSETLPRHVRGYGTAIVASFGILGAVVAALMDDAARLLGFAYDWRTAYVIGGVMGLLLLVARFSLRDSSMYHALEAKTVRRGAILMLFSSRERFSRYAYSLLVGLPVWFVIGILVGLSPELAPAIGVRGIPDGGTAILFCYLGASAGDLASGFLSNLVRSRRAVLVAFLTGVACLIFAYVFTPGMTLGGFYSLCLVLGFFAGYWAVFVTNAAEQFGTNLRATVATTAPNFARGATIPLTLAYVALRNALDPVKAVLLVGSAAVLIALFAVRQLQETYGRDLDFVEHETLPAARVAPV